MGQPIPKEQPWFRIDIPIFPKQREPYFQFFIIMTILNSQIPYDACIFQVFL